MTADSTHTQAHITPEEALTRCLDEMERGATKLRFRPGLREYNAGKALPKFKDNHAHWDQFQDPAPR